MGLEDLRAMPVRSKIAIWRVCELAVFLTAGVFSYFYLWPMFGPTVKAFFRGH